MNFKRLQCKHLSSGFTLIESAIVLFIISLLMLLILPNLNTQRQKAVETHQVAMVSTIQTQIDLYINDHPDKKNVTIEELKSAGYLTSKQAQKSKELKIAIANNEAHR